MDVGQTQALLQQQAQFQQQTVEQQTNAHTQAMNALAERVRALQIVVRAAAESKFLAKDKEIMTTKRAFTMLLHYSGKVEEYETWRFQLIQFLSQGPYFVEFPEWIENDLYSEDQYRTAIEEMNLEHEAAARNVCSQHWDPPTLLEKKEAHEVRMKCLQLDWYCRSIAKVICS